MLCNAYVNPIELMSNVEGDEPSVNMVKDAIYHLNCVFMLMSLSQSLSRASEGMSPLKKPIGADDIKKDATRRETFS